MKHTGYIHPTYIGWQIDWPVFVKIPFSAFGKYWKKGEEFNWHSQINADAAKISQLYSAGYIYHNRDLEESTKVGDRLSEMDSDKLLKLIRLVNAEIKQRTTTEKEFNNKRIKQSKIDDKQRGLIRAWLYRNEWMREEYYRIRDSILEE